MSGSVGWQYTDRRSALEDADPALKIVSAAVVVVALVVQPHWEPKAVQVAALVALWLGAGVGGRALATVGLALAPLAGMTLVSAWVTAGPGGVPWPKTAALEFQIAGVFLVLALVVRTTSPARLAEGLERLAAPLGRRGVAVHEAVLMFTIALRFVPLLLEEFRAIARAQWARSGAHTRGAWSKALALPALLVPLFVLSVLRAQALAEAMEARGYDGAEGRTPLPRLRWRLIDAVALGLAGADLIVALVFLGPGPGAR